MLKNIVFDLGGVLADWDPKYLYYKVLNDDKNFAEFLLESVVTQEWNAGQDEGRSIAEAVETLSAEYPQYAQWIALYYDRWEEMLKGSIEGTVEILEQLHQKKTHRLLALTNWSHETFPVAQRRFSWLTLFEGIVVSGVEKCMKPQDKIFQILLERHQINAQESLFIDDNLDNIHAAAGLGFKVIHFKNPSQLKTEMQNLGIDL